MTPTRVRLLVGLAAIAAALGWGALTLIEGQSGRVIPVPWLASATMWVLAIAIFIWALLSRPRLQRQPDAKPMPPLVAARTAALAMAASRVGALVGGFYLGVAIGAYAQRLSPAGFETLLASSAAALGSLAVVGAALWLEKLCRLPLDGDGDASGGGGITPKPRSEPGSIGARIGSSS